LRTYAGYGIKRGAERPPTGLVHGGKTMRPRRGKTRTRRSAAVSTITTERPDVVRTVPEWRRICHIYEDDSEISVCGTAVRRRGEEHQEAACRARGHTICVV
jgi:hypothetical protein